MTLRYHRTSVPPVEKPLLARYALEQVAETWTRDTLQSRPASLWRYLELLPISNPADIVTLGETMTPPHPYKAVRSNVWTHRRVGERRIPIAHRKLQGARFGNGSL